mgnify:CR=1 FL=1
MVRIALDAMGGDNAPQSVIEGADLAKARSPQLDIVFVGDEALIRPLLNNSVFAAPIWRAVASASSASASAASLKGTVTFTP